MEQLEKTCNGVACVGYPVPGGVTAELRSETTVSEKCKTVILCRQKQKS